MKIGWRQTALLQKLQAYFFLAHPVYISDFVGHIATSGSESLPHSLARSFRSLHLQVFCWNFNDVCYKFTTFSGITISGFVGYFRLSVVAEISL